MAREFYFERDRNKFSLHPAPPEEIIEPYFAGTNSTAGFGGSTSSVVNTDFEYGNNFQVAAGNTEGNLSTGVANYNQIQSEMVFVSGKFNLVGTDVENSLIIGDNNELGSNTNNVGILGGNNNTIQSGVNNSFIINSSNKYVSSDNVVYIADSLIIKNGQISPIYSIVDGGEDVVVRADRESNISIADGGEDTVFNLFSEEVITVMDGGEDNIYTN